MTATTKSPDYLDPQRLYSRRGFIAAAGISQTRMREAAQQGIRPEWFSVGRRKFIEGDKAIAFVKALAQS